MARVPLKKPIPLVRVSARLSLSRRRFVESTLAAFSSMALPACGGGGASAQAAEPGPTGVTPPAPPPTLPPPPVATPAMPPAPQPIDAPPVPVASPAPVLDAAPGPAPADAAADSRLTSLVVHATLSGIFPFVATVLPLRGAVPAGFELSNPADPALQSSVLGTHDDGSAAVVLVSGQAEVAAGAVSTIGLWSSATAASRQKPLAAVAIASAVRSVRVDLGRYGTVDLKHFNAPEQVWWANSQTICARYRAAAPLAGDTALEAVVDIHAFADGRALVEVVVENCKLNCPAPGSPPPTRYEAALPKPASGSYGNATVAVNGTVVGNADSAAAPEGSHAFARAWYCAAWVGGDPGLRVTQLHTDLQQHPLLFQCDQAGSDMALYAADRYTPWSTGRHRPAGMAGGGDHPSIGPLPQWEARFLQTGDWRAAAAVEASALAVLGYNINYRDAGTGFVPAASQLIKRTQTSSERNFPGDGADAMGWDAAHQPAGGLLAFICRPSPVYIEQAQKIAVWNATRFGQSTITSGWAGAAMLSDNTTGVLGFSGHQVRGFAWGVRNLVQATFLSHDGSAWKTGGRYWLNRNRIYLDAWRTNAKAKLNTLWEYGPDGDFHSHNSGPGFSTAIWMQHYLITELHKAAAVRLLKGPEQDGLSVTADWVAMQPVRWINEQSQGAWRFMPYQTPFGRSAATVDSLPDWGQQMAWATGGAAPAAPVGSWINTDGRSYNGSADTRAGAFYPSYFWAALVAAVERHLPGSEVAWQSVRSHIVDLSSWRQGFAAEPRWGASPRNS